MRHCQGLCQERLLSCFSPSLFPYVPAWLPQASLQLSLPCEPFRVLDELEKNIALMLLVNQCCAHDWRVLLCLWTSA